MLQVLHDKSRRNERNFMHLNDMTGAAVLKVVDEPSFDNVANLCRSMTHARTIIGLKEYPFAVGVDWNGTINRAGYGYFDSFDLVPKADRDRIDILYFRIGEPARLIMDFGWEHVHRELLSGHLPVVTTWTTCQGIKYSVTCFAHSEEDVFHGRYERHDSVGSAKYGKEKSGLPYRILRRPGKTAGFMENCFGRVNPGESKTVSFRLTYENSRRKRTDDNYWASHQI